MNGRMDDFDLVDKVAPLALSAYVEARGWKKTEPFGDLGASYSFGDGGVEVFVPTSRRLADFAIRTWETAGAIAEVEERSWSEVLRDLLCDDVDKAQVRLPKTASDGSIPISAGARIIRESRNMLLAAACSASHPQPAFSVRRRARARRYVKDVRLGQTERGSFVINLLSPVHQSLDIEELVKDETFPPTPPVHQPFDIAELVEGEIFLPPPDGADDDPFPRRATRKLASGLKALREAADFSNGGSNFTAFEEMVEDGVSANLCDAVGKMVGKRNPVEIEISVKWALAIPPPEESGAPILFSGPDARILDEASKILKKRHESHLS